MKKLILLTSILFLIWTASSGQGTSNTTSKDTLIEIPKPAAKEVVKDLLRGDSAISELKLVEKNLQLSEKQSLAKDSIITNLNRQIGIYQNREINWEKILELKQTELDLETELSKKLAKDLRKTKIKKTFSQILSSAAILTLGVLYITK